MLQNAAQNINIYRINGFFRCNWSNFIHLRVTLATTVCRSWMVSTENHTNKGRNWQYSVILTPLQTWRLVCTLILCVSALWLSSDPFHQLLALPSPAAKGLLHWQGTACAISYGWEPLLTAVNLCVRVTVSWSRNLLVFGVQAVCVIVRHGPSFAEVYLNQTGHRDHTQRISPDYSYLTLITIYFISAQYRWSIFFP